MSSESQPISADRFREAIKELPAGSLHTKAAELRNSIAHLQASNEQLKEFAETGDRDCAEAILENEGVIQRMEQRISILKEEVEDRGLRWYEEHETEGVNGGAPQNTDRERIVNGDIDDNEHQAATSTAEARSSQVQPQPNGRLSDQELQRLLAERLGEPDNANEEGGVYL